MRAPLFASLDRVRSLQAQYGMSSLLVCISVRALPAAAAVHRPRRPMQPLHFLLPFGARLERERKKKKKHSALPRIKVKQQQQQRSTKAAQSSSSASFAVVVIHSLESSIDYLFTRWGLGYCAHLFVMFIVQLVKCATHTQSEQ